MTKALITAIFLSQVPIQDLRVFHTQTALEFITYGNPVYTRRVDTFHIRRSVDNTVVVPQPPIPYSEYWDCSWGQTAQQCVAITSMLQQELGTVDESPLGKELQAVKKRIEEKLRHRNLFEP